MTTDNPEVSRENVRIEAAGVVLEGDLALPADPLGLVLFAHGSGSSRHSPRNQAVARELNRARLGTLLIDLLSSEEEQVDLQTRHLRFDIGLLAERLAGVADWLTRNPSTGRLRVGLFGASTGGGAALVAAAARPEAISAVVSRGGRPDLAGAALPRVKAPTLLIVGSEDRPVIQMNRDAMRQMTGEVLLEIVPGASHLFEEPGKLEIVAELARDWMVQHLAPDARDPRPS